MMIPIINVKEKAKKTDSFIKLFNYVKKVIFIQDIINKKNDLIIVLYFSYFFCIILFFHIFYLMFNQNKKLKLYILTSLNILSFLLQNCFLCPLINIFMLERYKTYSFRSNFFISIINMYYIFNIIINLF